MSGAHGGKFHQAGYGDGPRSLLHYLASSSMPTNAQEGWIPSVNLNQVDGELLFFSYKFFQIGKDQTALRKSGKRCFVRRLEILVHLT